jgi:hypothetical protein
MRYAKPELVGLTDARVAIQSGDTDSEITKSETVSDNPPKHDTAAAYEADE